MGVWIHLGDLFPDGFEAASRIDENLTEKKRQREKNHSKLEIPSFHNFSYVFESVDPIQGFQVNGKMQSDDVAIPLELLEKMNYGDSQNLRSFSQLLNWMNLNSQYQNTWIKLPTSHKAAAPTVFHYTSSAGAIGILEDRRFRATSIKYMNDRQEFDLGLGLVKELLANVLSSLNIGADQKKFMKRVFIEVNSALQKSQLFVLCASRDGDSLSQWRGYGKDHIGEAAGYSLGVFGGAYGFIENLGSLANSPSRLPYRRWHEVYYQEEEQKDLLNMALAFCVGLVPWVPDWKKFLKTTQFESLLKLASAVVVDCLASCKHESFSEEQEVRMIFSLSVGDGLTRHRPGGTGIVPYINIQLTKGDPWLGMMDSIRRTGIGLLEKEPLPIVKIMVGPSAVVGVAESGLDSLVKSTNHHKVSIERSRSPYR